MTIWDYMMEFCDGELDQDVCDTELDIWVCFCCDADMENSSDSYDRFLTLLAKNVQVANNPTEQVDGTLTCKFSDWAEKYNKQIRETMQKNGGYFEFTDPDEAYLNFVSDLDALIPGGASDSTYQMWLDVFQGD